MRFDIHASSLPDILKQRLLLLNDQRISKEGIVIIKAQAHRSQEKNKAEALQRLEEMVMRIAISPRARIPTKPTRSANRKRLAGKNNRSELKASRSRIDD